MATAVKQRQMFIGGEWVDSTSDERLPVVNPATNEIIAEIPRGSEEDVDRAVKAAHGAFDEVWFDSTPGERQAMLLKLADQQADRIRREADDEAKQQVSEARDLAQQIRREAEEEDERIRLQAEEVLQHAVAERDRLLGGLSLSRELALAELSTARDHLSGIVAQLESAMEVARSAHIGEPAEATAEGPGESPAEDLRAEDLLERTEGFDIIMPEFLSMEQGDETPA